MKIYVLKYQYYISSGQTLPYNYEYFSTEELQNKRLESLISSAKKLNLLVSYDTSTLDVDKVVEQ